MSLFQSPEEARKYAADFGFDQVEADILDKKMGQSATAAEIHFSGGRYTTALAILLRGTGPIQADVQEQCVHYLLTGLWRFMPLGVEFSKNLPYEARSLLRLTNKVMQDCPMTEYDRAQVRRDLIFSLC